MTLLLSVTCLLKHGIHTASIVFLNTFGVITVCASCSANWNELFKPNFEHQHQLANFWRYKLLISIFGKNCCTRIQINKDQDKDGNYILSDCICVDFRHFQGHRKISTNIVKFDCLSLYMQPEAWEHASANVLPWLMSLILPANTRILCHWYSSRCWPMLRFLHSWYVGRHWLGQGSPMHSMGHPVSYGMTLRPSGLYGSILQD